MEKKPLTVAQTIAAMLRAYPFVFRNRADSLMILFRAYDTKWVDGHLVAPDHMIVREGREPILEDEETKVRKDTLRYAGQTPDDLAMREANVRLRVRRYNAEMSFIVDNAALLAVEEHSDLSYVPSDEFLRRIDDMPDDVAPEWLEAAKELALLIMAYNYAAKDMGSKDIEARDRDTLDRAKKAARQFLDRFTPKGAEDTARRAARLVELRREAAALGVTLVV